MKEHHHLSLVLYLGDSAHPQVLMLDQSPQPGACIQTTNHRQDSQYWAMQSHVLAQLHRGNLRSLLATNQIALFSDYV